MASLGQHGSGDHDRADIRAPQEFLNAPDAVDGLQHVRLLGSPAVVPGPQGVGKPIEEVGCRCPVGGADGVGVVIVADVPGVAVGIGNPSERSRDWRQDLVPSTPAEGASQWVSGWMRLHGPR